MPTRICTAPTGTSSPTTPWAVAWHALEVLDYDLTGEFRSTVATASLTGKAHWRGLTMLPTAGVSQNVAGRRVAGYRVHRTRGNPIGLDDDADMATIDLLPFGMSRRYQELLERSVDILTADDRVVALFVVGSVGRGEADASSDLDLAVSAVDDGAQRALIGDWRTWAAAITPWVYGRCLRDTVVSLVTPGWERLDVSVVAAASTNRMTSGPATCLFDRVGVEPPSSPVAELPDADALAVRVEAFIRSLGLLVTDLERQEFTVLTWASEFMIQELVDLMFLASGRARRTVKRIYVDLPRADRDVLDSIPRPLPSREGILVSHLATAAEYLPRARTLLAAVGGTWPEAFERATDAYLLEHLGVGLRPPTHYG